MFDIWKHELKFVKFCSGNSDKLQNIFDPKFNALALRVNHWYNYKNWIAHPIEFSNPILKM